MDRHAKILRRDARAPFCLDPLPSWRYEHAFHTALKQFLASDSEALSNGIDVLTAHHSYSQDFVMIVDSLIIADPVSQSQVLGTFVRMLDTCRSLAGLRGGEKVLELLREKLVQKFEIGEGGSTPEFYWEKGAAELFFGKVGEAGIDEVLIDEDLFVHVDDVYDDCARTVQLGLWIMVSPWRAAVIDSWIFESAYAFFHHTLKKHICGAKGMLNILPKFIGSLKLEN